MQAIQVSAIAGGDEVGGVLVNVTADSTSGTSRAAALNGLLIAGDDKAVLELYRAARTPTRTQAAAELVADGQRCGLEHHRQDAGGRTMKIVRFSGSRPRVLICWHGGAAHRRAAALDALSSDGVYTWRVPATD
jgi:hypothetical protein